MLCRLHGVDTTYEHDNISHAKSVKKNSESKIVYTKYAWTRLINLSESIEKMFRFFGTDQRASIYT